MKRILAVICFSFLSLSFANAEILSVGISGNVGMLEGNGKETITGTSERAVTYISNIASGNSNERSRADGVSSTSTTKGADDIFIGYVSVFGEAHLMDTGLRVGVSYVPYALESETTDNTRNDNCSQPNQHLTTGNNNCTATKQTVQVDLEDLISMYVAYHHEIDLGLIDSVFVKGGVIQADVITKEKLASGSQYGNTTLSGQFIGLGVEKNMDNGLFVRVEGNVTQYQSIKLTNQLKGTDENKNTIDITDMDGATATLSIGKSF